MHYIIQMKSTEYNIKLTKSIQKYVKWMTDYKINRASIILLNEQIKHSSDKNLQDKTCTARKNNGSKCPSIRKKGQVYCHRHFKIIEKTCTF